MSDRFSYEVRHWGWHDWPRFYRHISYLPKWPTQDNSSTTWHRAFIQLKCKLQNWKTLEKYWQKITSQIKDPSYLSGVPSKVCNSPGAPKNPGPNIGSDGQGWVRPQQNENFNWKLEQWIFPHPKLWKIPDLSEFVLSDKIIKIYANIKIIHICIYVHVYIYISLYFINIIKYLVACCSK